VRGIATEFTRRVAVCSSNRLGFWWLIILTLREEILADNRSESDVRDRDGNNKANNLKNARHFLKRHPAGTQKRGNEATDDHAENATADGGDKKEEKPSFEILKFSGFFHAWCDIDLTRTRSATAGGSGRDLE
jgi:hypothetical protein